MDYPLSLQKIKKTFNQFVQISNQDWEYITPCIKTLSLKKGDFFIREGQVCNMIGYLNEGILRVFYNADGKEVTSYFNTSSRNPVVCGFYSFLSGKPSVESIQAIEDSELIVISNKELNELYEQKPVFQKLGRILAEQNYLASVSRIYSFQHNQAQERYEELLKKYKPVINRIPQQYIASYLGITPESLSRIRTNLAKKNS